jgi:hypothetical protein
VALALAAAAAIAVLTDDEEKDSQAASWSAAWKNRYLSQLAKRAKQEGLLLGVHRWEIRESTVERDGWAASLREDEGRRSNVELVCNLQFTRCQQRSDRRFKDTRSIISRDREVRDAERVCIRAIRIVVYHVIYFLLL